MTRSLLPYYNMSSYGKGLEGFMNFANSSVDNWMIPLFLLVFYSVSLFLSTKNEYKFGGQILFVSFVFFILAMLAQTFTTFNQLIIFIFAIGMIVGLVISFIENAKT